MNNQLWTYIQELKKGNIQLADLKGCLSETTGNAFEAAFAGLPSDRPLVKKSDSMWPGSSGL